MHMNQGTQAAARGFWVLLECGACVGHGDTAFFPLLDSAARLELSGTWASPL